jgi:hypothetical protein
MHMKPVCIYLLIGAFIQSLCCAAVTRLPVEARRVLQDASRFHEVHSISELPAAVVALCGSELAEPGGKWNATDSITDPTLPGKRLIWAATGGEYFVMHYERGGIAHSYHILIATLAKGDTNPKVIWRAVGGPFKDYAAFVDALRNGKLDDSLAYSKFW